MRFFILHAQDDDASMLQQKHPLKTLELVKLQAQGFFSLIGVFLTFTNLCFTKLGQLN